MAEPIGGEISVVSESDMVENVHKTAIEKVLAEQLKSSKFSKPDQKSPSKGCYYTSIPRVIKLKGASGQDLTNMNLDKVSGLNLRSFYKLTSLSMFLLFCFWLVFLCFFSFAFDNKL